MATVKVKLRPSKVEGKTGVIYYQVIHNRKTQQITTRLRVCPSDWDADEEKLVSAAPNRTMIHNRIDSDVALLRIVIADLDSCGVDYSVKDIINRYKSPRTIFSCSIICVPKLGNCERQTASELPRTTKRQ